MHLAKASKEPKILEKNPPEPLVGVSHAEQDCMQVVHLASLVPPTAGAEDPWEESFCATGWNRPCRAGLAASSSFSFHFSYAPCESQQGAEDPWEESSWASGWGKPCWTGLHASSSSSFVGPSQVVFPEGQPGAEDPWEESSCATGWDRPCRAGLAAKSSFSFHFSHAPCESQQGAQDPWEESSCATGWNTPCWAGLAASSSFSFVGPSQVGFPERQPGAEDPWEESSCATGWNRLCWAGLGAGIVHLSSSLFLFTDIARKPARSRWFLRSIPLSLCTWLHKLSRTGRTEVIILWPWWAIHGVKQISLFPSMSLISQTYIYIYTCNIIFNI